MPRRNQKTTNSKRISKLERVTRPEVKFSPQQSGAFDDIGSVSGTILHPQRLGQGTSRNNRIGDKVKSRNIRFQAIMKMPSNPANATCAVRLLVLRSKKQHPTTSDMPAWYAPVDEDKFFVIKDVLTQVSLLGSKNSSGSSSLTGSTLKKFNFNIPCGSRKLQYDGSSSDITATDNRPINNEYIVYALASNASAEFAWNMTHYYMDN